MSEQQAKSRRPAVADPVQERAAWIALLGELVREIEGWVQPDWSTRIIDKEMYDSILGGYHAPALLMQRTFTRILVDPITRFAPGVDGVVDLYLMPAFDDIATVLRIDGSWKIHYGFQGREAGGIRNAEALPWGRENFSRVLDSIAGHAA